MFGRSRLLVRHRDGTWELKLGPEHRELLASLAQQLDDLIGVDPEDPRLGRLFPTAYPDDIAHEAEWQVFKAAELRSTVQEHLGVLRTVAERTTLTDKEVHSWMRAINAIRLVLGTRLDMSEDEIELDPDDPDAQTYALYDFLSYLLDSTVTALSR